MFNRRTGSFNHKLIYVTPDTAIKTISMHGKEGWEAVSLSPAPTKGGFCLLLKKPMNGGLSVNDVKELRTITQGILQTVQAISPSTEVTESVTSSLQDVLDFLGK